MGMAEIWQESDAILAPPLFLIPKVDNLIRLLFLLGHLYMINMSWFGVAPRIDIRKTCVKKRSDYVLNVLKSL